ncbi:MAG TPA: hypothetical protein PKY95_03900, partial [candidate division Zixibacteria bacterium]|nr:hypothetical protein [candidate division Zixibacteria bacterium]
MNVAAVLYALGKLMQVMGGFLLAPLAIALWDGRVQGLPRLFAAADASGLLVLPGMFEAHAHLMDPAESDREDMPTGTAAAAALGITTLIEH